MSNMFPEILNDVPTRKPEIPAELWMLWEGSGWVVSVDEAPGGPTYLVAFSEADADSAAAHQEETFGVECVPVRVK